MVGQADVVEIESGIQWVKAGADSKEKALLVVPRALRRICVALTLVVFLVLSFVAWSVQHLDDVEERADQSRLQHAIRSTAERVGIVERLKERLHKTGNSSVLVQALHLNRELHEAQRQLEHAQEDMMLSMDSRVVHNGVPPAGAKMPPHDIQRRMLEEFTCKAEFLLWSTQPDLTSKWRDSSRFGLQLSADIVQEVDRLHDQYTNGRIESQTLVGWLRGNVSAGR